MNNVEVEVDHTKTSWRQAATAMVSDLSDRSQSTLDSVQCRRVPIIQDCQDNTEENEWNKPLALTQRLDALALLGALVLLIDRGIRLQTEGPVRIGGDSGEVNTGGHRRRPAGIAVII